MTIVTHIAVKIRRVTEEVAYVKVPVSDELMEAMQRGDQNFLGDAACSIGRDGDCRWIREVAPVVEVNPMQSPAPAGYYEGSSVH